MISDFTPTEVTGFFATITIYSNSIEYIGILEYVWKLKRESIVHPVLQKIFFKYTLGSCYILWSCHRFNKMFNGQD